MCDALVALGETTRDGSVIFAKNSDRPAGECQVLHSAPAAQHRSGEVIQCTYLRVPEEERSLATVGCRPYWCWGYETGVNEAGVVGGNTAIFTKSIHLLDNRQELGLTGMDLLRLALARSESAESATETIIDLLEQHGQWGSAIVGRDHESGSYENAFLLADRNEAWVLETSGRRWISRRIEKGFYALSNQPTIRDKWTNICADMFDFASDNVWWQPDREAFDFAQLLGDHEHYSRQVSHLRWQRSQSLLKRSVGAIDASTMMSIMRDHYEDSFLQGPQFNRFLPDFHTICMHDSPSGFTWGNTATSLIVELPRDGGTPLLWAAYQPPCASIYFSFSLTDSLPEMLLRTGTAGLVTHPPEDAPPDAFDPSSLWWRLYRVIGAISDNPINRYKEASSLFESVERENLHRIETHRAAHRPVLDKKEAIDVQLAQIIDAIETLEHKWKLV